MASYRLSLPLATADRGKARHCNPVWSAVGPHAKYTIVNSRVINLSLFCDTFPSVINPIEPNMVGISHSVVVDIEFADFWGYFRRWGHDLVHGRRSIPSGNSRRARAKWPLLFERS